MALTYKEYTFLYETHLHTNAGSACASNSGAEMAKAAHKFGYAGIFVTEHNWGGNTIVPRSLPWEKWVEYFFKGYDEALAYGRKHDFDVFPGYEAGFHGTEFLIYGITPEWLMEHPELKDADVEEHNRIIREAGGFVVHAHPFREEFYIPEVRLFPESVDAVEGINATHSCSKSKSHKNPIFDEKAIDYARLYNLPMTAGSDVHSRIMLGGGILTKKRIRSAQEYRQILLSGDYYLTNGDRIYNSQGEVVV